MTKKKKKHKVISFLLKAEFSKLILIVSHIETLLITSILLFLAINFALSDIIVTAIISVSWASVISGNALYYSKAKAQNINDQRMKFLKFKVNKMLELKKIGLIDTEDMENEIEEEFDRIDEGLQDDLETLNDEELQNTGVNI